MSGVLGLHASAHRVELYGDQTLHDCSVTRLAVAHTGDAGGISRHQRVRTRSCSVHRVLLNPMDARVS